MAVDRSQNRHVLAGALIVLIMVALPVLVLFVPDLIRRLTSSAEIFVVMPEAGILEKSTPVWIAGREVGKVREVHLRSSDVDSMERVAIRMSIPEKYLTHIRQDSEVRLTSARLIGEPVLDILPGSPGAPPIREGDTLHVRTSGTLPDVIASMLGLTESFQQFFVEMQKLKELASPARAQQLERLNRSFGAAMAEFRTLVVTLRSSPINTLTDPEFKQILSSLQARSGQLTEALRLASQRAAAARSDMEPALTRMMARGDTIQAVLADIQARIDAGGGGLLIRAQTDTAIIKALHEAQAQLDSLIAESKSNPLRFWF